MKGLIFIIGICFGSFFNVCIHRIPRKKSIFSFVSYCPQCCHQIKWYDNIPIFSYFLLRGRCRSCGQKIPIRYLVVEVITGIIFLATYLKFKFSIPYFIYLFFFSILIISSFIDIELKIIPDVITLLGIIVGICGSPFTIGMFSSLVGGVVGIMVGGFFLLLGKFLFKKEALGLGDIKLLGMIGCFVGWTNVLLILFFASFIGLTFVLFKREPKISLAPFLFIGSFINNFLLQPILYF
jgi:leader peptidase (prepilin peptidase)/N-methyltransferase